MKKILLLALVFISTFGYCQIDPLEYPVGHPNYSGVANPATQLRNYPAPRYKNGHTLLPNFNWIDPIWAAERWQSGVTDAQAVINSVDIQTELAKNWNYYFNVSSSADNFNAAWKTAINANSSFKIGLIVFRAQSKGCGGSSCMWCQCLANDHYLNNASGQILNEGGNVTTVKSAVRPTAPLASFRQDGINMRGYLSSSLPGLNRPVNLVNENGEVYPFLDDAAMAKDPQVTAAKNASGLDWKNYLASRWRAFDNDYSSQFMSLSILANAKYTQYRLDGHRDYQFRWEQAKFFNSQITGNYYSTADFYVRWPSNWKDWVSAWHGLRWITESRHYEITSGDKLFSPFIAAGWDDNPELDVRPAQWLGLLKLLGIYGAEFYYSSYFNLDFSQTNPPPNPKSYCWQIAIPSYAQAITSQAEDILRTGSLLPGDMTNTLHDPDIPYYQFNTGATNKVIAIRGIANKYLMSGTYQNSSNVINSTPINSTAVFTLNGEQLTINIRRQGSTYIYDNSSPSNKVFYQLDGWHEYSHPSRWSKDIEIEAEVFNSATGFRKSYLPSFPNLTSFITVVTLSNNQTSSYTVFPRDVTTKYLFVKASGSGTLEANVDGALYNFSVNGLGWYKVSLGSITASSHNLILKSLGTHEVDSISVTSNATKYPTTVTPPPPACTYTYSAWSVCVAGTQTRTVISATPAGCVGTPILSQSCSSPACTYTYSGWSACVNNIQTRTVLTALPAGCTGTPVLSQSCIPAPTSCTLDGLTIFSGQSQTFYNSSTVPCGSVCQSIVRTCTNGVLSGDNSFNKASCSVLPCPPGTCNLPSNIISKVTYSSFWIWKYNYKVTISFTAAANATSYLIELTKGTTITNYTTTTTSITIAVSAKTDYKFRVRTTCTGGINSSWSIYYLFNTR